MKSENTELLLEGSFLDEGDLPEFWKLIELKELCSKITDGTHVTPKYIENGIPFISTSNIDPYHPGFDFSAYKKNISIEDHHALTKRCKPEKGDLLISKCGTIGRTKLVDVDYEFSIFVGLGLIKLKKGGVSGKYLELVLNAGIVQKQLGELAPGSTRKTLPINKIGKIKIPLAPLSEQQRIVARVEALFSHVNSARERLNRVPLIMKRFRQAVLAAACCGRLTDEWREKNPYVETSSQFLKSYFKRDVEPITDLVFNDTELPNIPESWVWIEFGKVISELKNGVYLVGPNLEPPGNPILRISSVRPGKVHLDDIKYLPNSDAYLGEYHLRDGDLLFTRYNGSLELVGICGLVREIYDRVLLYPDKLIRVRFGQNCVMPEYAETFFQSFTARTNVYSVIKSSAGQKGISGNDIKIQPFPLPPFAEQHEIVRRVGALFERADAIEREVAAATKRTEALTQAVLGKAFRGEMTQTRIVEECV